MNHSTMYSHHMEYIGVKEEMMVTTCRYKVSDVYVGVRVCVHVHLTVCTCVCMCVCVCNLS